MNLELFGYRIEFNGIHTILFISEK